VDKAKVTPGAVPPDGSGAPATAGNKQVDTGAACLVTLLRFFGMPGEIGQIRHQFAEPGTPMDADALLRAAKRLGLRAKLASLSAAKLGGAPLPAIAEMQDGRFVILAKASDDKVLIQDPAAGRPETPSVEEFVANWTGRLLQLTRRAAPLGRGGKFDVSWFVPAVLRYKRLFGEVLVASFFLQVFGLITPLFFQVIIDKVLVHRGLTTLDVLIIGLVVVSVFEVLMGTLRTYIFSHTTNRIDVELGAKLFHHLLALPMAYFEARRVGDSVARVRELENIRNFLTGSALTLVIDVAFTGIFFAVMWYFSPTLTLVVLAAIPFYVGLSVLVTPVLRARLDEKFRRGAEN